MFFILNHGVSELTDVAGTAVRSNPLTTNWKGGLYLLWQLGLKVSLGRRVLKSEAGIDSPVVWNHLKLLFTVCLEWMRRSSTLTVCNLFAG